MPPPRRRRPDSPYQEEASPPVKDKIAPIVLVGLPTLEPRPLSWEWADAWQSLSFPLGASVSKLRIINRTVADARNEIAAEALRMDASWVLYIGDDVLPPPNLFDLLSRHRKHMVTGIYWTKEPVPKPYIWRDVAGPYLDWKAGEFVQVDWAGVDATLISTEVFRKVEYPWFSQEWTFEENQTVLPFATEDLYFYAKARKAGFQLWADTAAQCHHQDRRTGKFYALTMDMPQAQPTAPHPDPEQPGRLIADIGAGHDTPFFGRFSDQITRYDGDPECHPDVLCDIRAIPAPDEHFDIVHARHVLEHFADYETDAVLSEWIRILKVGGEIRVNVPNITYAAREILKADAGEAVGRYPLWQFFGHQNGSPGEVHRIAFTARGLRFVLEAQGLADVTVEECGQLGESLEGRGRKAASSRAPAVVPWLREGYAREQAAREKERAAMQRDITATMAVAEAAQEQEFAI